MLPKLRVKTFIAKKIYKAICKIYQNLTTIYENQFLKVNVPKEDFLKTGIFQLSLQNNVLIDKKENLKIISVNDFLNIKHLNIKQINNLLEQIFTEDIRNQITEITGFNFSIDFTIFYERKYIPLKLREVSTLKQPYSYRWHFDKPNSSNMLKIFLPIDIEDASGPLEVIKKSDSRNIRNFNKISLSQERIFFKGGGKIIYGFYPTICCHRDGIPNKNIVSNQIMFQLNPNKKWVINTRLYERKSLLKNKIGIWTTEPKFPHLSYLFDERISLKN